MTETEWTQVGLVIAGILAPLGAIALIWKHAMEGHRSRLESQKTSLEIEKLRSDLPQSGPERRGWPTRKGRIGLGLAYTLTTIVIVVWFALNPPLTARSVILIVLVASAYPTLLTLMLGLGLLDLSERWWSSIGHLIVRTNENIAEAARALAAETDHEEGHEDIGSQR